MVVSRVCKGVFIVAANRTPFGKYGGKLKNISTMDLQTVAINGAIKNNHVKREWVSYVCIGNTSQTPESALLGRNIALQTKIPLSSPGITLNRMCGSGIQAIITSSMGLNLGENEVVISGGTENMSQMGKEAFHSRGRQVPGPTKGFSAEKFAEKYGVSRTAADEYTQLSRQRWKDAFEAGHFDKEIVPITITNNKGEKEVMTVDEISSSLPSSTSATGTFIQEGSITDNNSAALADGAGCVILATEDACVKYNMKPLARLVGYSIVGCDPSLYGLGCVPAIESLLTKSLKKLSMIDLIEINDIYASTYLAVEKALKLDRTRTNIHGGALAVGNPISATGVRNVTHLVHHLRKNKMKLGLVATSVLGGQGMSMLIEAF